jgi:hypothetical protein
LAEESFEGSVELPQVREAAFQRHVHHLGVRFAEQPGGFANTPLGLPGSQRATDFRFEEAPEMAFAASAPARQFARRLRHQFRRRSARQ